MTATLPPRAAADPQSTGQGRVNAYTSGKLPRWAAPALTVA